MSKLKEGDRIKIKIGETSYYDCTKTETPSRCLGCPIRTEAFILNRNSNGHITVRSEKYTEVNCGSLSDSVWKEHCWKKAYKWIKMEKK